MLGQKKKNERIGVKLNEEELEQIQELKSRMDLTTSEIVRIAIHRLCEDMGIQTKVVK